MQSAPRPLSAPPLLPPPTPPLPLLELKTPKRLPLVQPSCLRQCRLHRPSVVCAAANSACAAATAVCAAVAEATSICTAAPCAANPAVRTTKATAANTAYAAAVVAS